MLAQEIRESLKTLSRAELLELKHSVDELCEAPKKKLTFEEAAEQVHTEYSHLLRKLSQ